MKYCPKCGKEIEDESTFCMRCGQRQPEMVFDYTEEERNTAFEPEDEQSISGAFVIDDPYATATESDAEPVDSYSTETASKKTSVNSENYSFDDLQLIDFGERNTEVNVRYRRKKSQHGESLIHFIARHRRIALICALAVVVLIAGFSILRSVTRKHQGGAKTTSEAVSNYVEAELKGDVKKIAQYSMCKELYSCIGSDKDKFLDEYDTTMKSNRAFKDISIKNIDYLPADKVDMINETIQQEYNAEFETKEIIAVTVAYIEESYSSQDDYNTIDMKLALYKYDDRWYVFNKNFDRLIKGTCNFCFTETIGVNSKNVRGATIYYCDDCSSYMDGIMNQYYPE